MMKPTFASCLSIFLMFLLFLICPVQASSICNLSELDALTSAYHLLIGMFGYSESSAKDLQYHAHIENESIATTVTVYLYDHQDDYFEFKYYADGSLIAENTKIPASGLPIPNQDLSPSEAINVSKHFLLGMMGYKQDTINSFMYEANIHDALGLIQVKIYPFIDNLDCYFSLEYYSDGRLMSYVIPELLDFSDYQISALETGRPFELMTHEERAQYSQTYIPKVEATLRLNPQDHNALHHYPYTRNQYGIPDETCLREIAALNAARRVLIDYFNESSKHVNNASFNVYFDVTNSDRFMWKFYFVYLSNNQVKRYMVHIDAHTGETINAFQITSQTPSILMY